MDINSQKFVNKLEKNFGLPIKMNSFLSSEGTVYKVVLDLNHMPSSYDYGRKFIKPEEYVLGIKYIVPRPYMDLMDYNNIDVGFIYMTYRLENLTSLWNLKAMRELLAKNIKYVSRSELNNTEITVKFKDAVKTVGDIIETQSNNFKSVIDICTDPTLDVMFDKISDINNEIEMKRLEVRSIENKMVNMLKATIGMKNDFG